MSSRLSAIFLAAALALGIAAADEPQTTMRSALNGVSLASGPASVARGGILAIVGSGLAAELTRAEAAPLPTSLEDPAVEVLVNGVAAPLFFVSPRQINAQVPWETETGRAEVVVRRGSDESAPMPVQITNANPSLFTHEGTSLLIVQDAVPGDEAPAAAIGGPGSSLSPRGDVLGADGTVSEDQRLTVFGAGIGPTDPAAVTGAVGSAAGLAPSAVQRAYVGGVPVEGAAARLSTDLVGVYDLSLTVPRHTGSGEILRWYSGNQSGAGILGAGGPLEARYMSVPAELESVARLDLSDLNPYFVAASGPLDEIDFCYANVQLLDFRRDTATAISKCLLPSNPLAASQAQYRPFELSNNSPVLAALLEPSAESKTGVTDRLLLVDTATGAASEIDIAGGADRLQSGFGATPNLRLLKAESSTAMSLFSPGGEMVGEGNANMPLASPLEVDGLSAAVAQGANFTGGYRLRFLGPGAEETGSPTAYLFDRDAEQVAKASFPDGWAPISPPRRTNAQGAQLGNSLAPAATGFANAMTAYVVARADDGSRDAVVSFAVALPGEDDPTGAAKVTTGVHEFPAGSFAANCTPQVRWQRIPLTRSLAIAGAAQATSDFASPFNNEVCKADRLVLFDTATSALKAVSSDEELDVALKGALSSYLYFGDGARSAALAVPEQLHVFDGESETFTEIDLPDGAGISINQYVQRLPGQPRLVALATGGPLRTNPRTGAQRPQLPGNRGMLVIDLAQAEAMHLALPDGYANVIQGPQQIFREGRRGYGAIPLLNRAFARARKPNAGPGQPGGSTMLTWDLADGTAAAIAMPDGGHFAVQAQGGGQDAQNPLLWDFSPRAGAFAFGVFNQSRELVSIGVVGQ